jgi:hypothetical protein
VDEMTRLLSMTNAQWRSEKPDQPGLWEARLGALSFARSVRYLVFRGEDGALWYASPRSRRHARRLDELPGRSLRRWRGPLPERSFERA